MSVCCNGAFCILIGLQYSCSGYKSQYRLATRPSRNAWVWLRQTRAVPVFEGEKWRRLDSNLRMRCRMASPSGSPKLGKSKRTSSEFFKYSSIQSIDERIEVSQFSMAILERETSARKLGRG